MSGIYLICWDEKQKDNSMLLKPTKGGYPHITIAYTGTIVDKESLVKLSTTIFNACALKTVKLTRAYVNSFSLTPLLKRHDVLLEVEPFEEIMAARTMLLQPLPNSEQFSMHPFHITHGIYYQEETAHHVAEELNRLLPYEVVITGVTIE